MQEVFKRFLNICVHANEKRIVSPSYPFVSLMKSLFSLTIELIFWFELVVPVSVPKYQPAFRLVRDTTVFFFFFSNASGFDSYLCFPLLAYQLLLLSSFTLLIIYMLTRP